MIEKKLNLTKYFTKIIVLSITELIKLSFEAVLDSKPSDK